MAPVMLAAKSFKILLKKSPHADNAVSHAFDLAQPLLVEAWVVQDLRSNPSSMDGRI